MAFVIPADQRQAALHHDPPLAALRRRGAADQHVLGQACAVALPGAQQAAAVDVWREESRDITDIKLRQNEVDLFGQDIFIYKESEYLEEKMQLKMKENNCL